MRILAISDTHGLHEELKVPEDIDVIICAGDISNEKNPGINSNECALFLNWYESLKIKYKLLIAGNHDTSIWKRLINPRDFKSIIYLEHEGINFEGLNIFGSPYTPTFGDNWAYNVDRSKLDKYWKHIKEDTDILITHGPPKGILDLSHDRSNTLEYCGDKSLLNHIFRVKPRFHIFGHLHNSEGNFNQGIRVIDGITFINASCITDRKFNEGLTSQGVIFEI